MSPRGNGDCKDQGVYRDPIWGFTDAEWAALEATWAPPPDEAEQLRIAAWSARVVAASDRWRAA